MIFVHITLSCGIASVTSILVLAWLARRNVSLHLWIYIATSIPSGILSFLTFDFVCHGQLMSPLVSYAIFVLAQIMGCMVFWKLDRNNRHDFTWEVGSVWIVWVCFLLSGGIVFGKLSFKQDVHYNYPDQGVRGSVTRELVYKGPFRLPERQWKYKPDLSSGVKASPLSIFLIVTVVLACWATVLSLLFDPDEIYPIVLRFVYGVFLLTMWTSLWHHHLFTSIVLFSVIPLIYAIIGIVKERL